MSRYELSLFWFGAGLCFGMCLANYLWRITIRDKAQTGIRLECGGQLFDVRYSEDQGS